MRRRYRRPRPGRPGRRAQWRPGRRSAGQVRLWRRSRRRRPRFLRVLWSEMEVGMSNIGLARTAPGDRGHGWATCMCPAGQAQSGAAAPAQEPVGERDHRIEMPPIPGPSTRSAPSGPARWRWCSAAVAGQRHSGRALGGDPGADHDGYEQAGAEQFGDGAAPQRRLVEKSYQQLDSRNQLSQN